MTTYDDTYFEEMAEAAEKGEFTPIPNTLLTGEEAGSLLWQCSKRQQEPIIIQNVESLELIPVKRLLIVNKANFLTLYSLSGSFSCGA